MGGSHTRARLARNHEIQTEALGAGTNITAVGSAEVRRRLAAVLDYLGNPRVDACCAGAAGTEDARARGGLERLLTGLLPGAGVSDPLALAAQLHGSREPEQWAALADAVFRAAAEDPGAQAIIEQGADSLADLAIRVAKRLGEPGPVVLAGGLLLHQPLLERA